MTGRRSAVAVVALSLVTAAVVVVGGPGVSPAGAQDAGIRATPATAAVGEEVTFSTPGVDAESYEWRFGDDTVTPGGATVTHEYLEPGTYTVTLEATADGESTTYGTTVTVEPAFANVTRVAPGGEVRTNGTVRGADVDVYAVEVPPGHHFAVRGSGGFGSDGLRVYDADGRRVAGTSLGPDSVLVGTTAPPDGETYHVAARQGYSYRALRFPETVPPDEFEPNQGRTTAERIDPDGDPADGVVGAADPVDWFAVGSGSGSVEVTVELDGVATVRPNVAVELYDANGTRIGELGPDARDGNRTAANGVQADYTAVQRADVPADGVYYVRVRAVSAADPIVPNSTPRVYDLSVDAPPAGPPPIGSAPPTDPDGDGRYEDVNGDGEIDVVDVQALFANLDAPAVRDSPQAFDFNGDGTVDVVDVQALFVETDSL
jgi:PKD repeat protein